MKNNIILDVVVPLPPQKKINKIISLLGSERNFDIVSVNVYWKCKKYTINIL